mmetsp:Transcript_5557/g.9521  ORF Transcript_5557/g.9521 Transcript_5557/m.9521 type:complete len:491 (-) Transcript_5557:61-1533(-)
MEKTEEKDKLVAQEQPAESPAEAQEGQQPEKKKKKKKKNKGGEEAELPTTEDAPKVEEESKEQKKGEEDESEEEPEGENGEVKAKKKKNKKKKKKGGSKQPGDRAQDNSELRLLGSWKPAGEGVGEWKQTIDYTIPVSQQFPDNVFPCGEFMDHPGDFNLKRVTDAEFRERDKLTASKVNDLRKAAECHRQVRKAAQKFARPGVKLIDICELIETTNRRLVEAQGLQQGIAFPTGCSINHCAAHYTPNPGDDTVLGYDDVMKIDFGTQINGHIIDCAFTVAFNPVYDNLLTAVKEATNEGIKQAGIDVRLCDIGAAIQEVMESHEVEIGNQVHTVKAVQNLCGHSIAPYQIHAGKSVPIVRGGPQTKMDEGELFAIETFGSTGKGRVFEAPDCSHYMKDFEAGSVALRHPRAKALLAHINNHFSTLAFCRRWIEDDFPKHVAPLKALVDAGVVNAYPPLNDVSGSYVAQYEHTIFLHPSRKEVLSRGDDY